MLSRIEFYDLIDGLKSVGIDFLEILPPVDRFITCMNSINYNSNTIHKIKMIRNAELLIREIIQLVIVNINPDLNRLIELDQKENDSHKNLINCIVLIQNKIEEQKKILVNNLSNKEIYDSNRITNKLNIEFYSLYLENLFKNLVEKTIQYAFYKYIITEEPVTDSEDYLRNTIKKFDSMQKTYIRIKKDVNLFWYFVFSHLFRSSQIIGFMPENQMQRIKPIEIKDLRRLVRVEIESEKLKKEDGKPQEGTPTQSPKKEEIPAEVTEEDDLDEDFDNEELGEENV